MNKLDGRNSNADKGDPPRQTEEEKKLEDEKIQLNLWGREMTGIGRSIEALIDLYNRKLE